jgi:hypothetical protein
MEAWMAVHLKNNFNFWYSIYFPLSSVLLFFFKLSRVGGQMFGLRFREGLRHDKDEALVFFLKEKSEIYVHAMADLRSTGSYAEGQYGVLYGAAEIIFTIMKTLKPSLKNIIIIGNYKNL